MVTHCSIIPSSPEFGDDFGVEEGAFLKPEDFSGPLRKQPYGLVKEGVHRYPYPYYLQPRFLYEREPVEVQQGLDMIPPSKKRVTKGMCKFYLFPLSSKFPVILSVFLIILLKWSLLLQWWT